MFVDPYKSTIVSIMHKKHVRQNDIFGVWTLFFVTNHSADKNIIIRHDIYQYLSGKHSFLWMPTKTNRIYF